MDSCQKCGHKLNPGQKFCPQCGTVQERKAASSSSAPPPQNRSREENRKGPSFFQSKKGRIITVVIVVLALGLFGAYQYIASTMTPSKIQSQFVDAVKKQNVKEMKQILNKNQTELDLNDAAITDFLAYFKKHPDVYAETVAQLKNDAGKLAVNKNYDNRTRPVSLVRDGKKWLVFDYYAVNVKPYAIKLEANQEPVEVSINGKSVGKLMKNNDTFGPYLLSDLTIEAKYKGEYTLVTKEESIDPYEEDSQNKEGIENIKVELDLSGSTVTVESNNEDAILYVNGKSTHKKIKDVGEFGPVKTDGSMKLQAVYTIDAHTVKSNEETITSDGQSVYLDILATDFVGDPPSYEDDYTYAGTDEESLGQTVENHYTYISTGNYEEAFALLSPKKKKNYNYDNWVRDSKNNYKNVVTITSATLIDEYNGEVQFTLTSYDHKPKGKALVQEWGGTWNLIYQDGRWLMNASKIKRIDSYTIDE
ncbi:zinc ribbon domain-containing protein [Bacillus rubiinfantis]|uniref:zinc ribbon domain-containing protein n=1 Tax=Bacillus rubiinfantis TaxID=1499680 RepID=UPI0005AB5CED|nr:zinc-ribbon domain-containing protein [Bacillus rubiinfantis]